MVDYSSNLQDAFSRLIGKYILFHKTF